MFVDVPGYRFAYHALKKKEEWKKLNLLLDNPFNLRINAFSLFLGATASVIFVSKQATHQTLKDIVYKGKKSK